MPAPTSVAEIEEIVGRAIASGEAVGLRDIGGEAAVVGLAAALARSPLFGDVVDAMVREWEALADKERALAFFSDGVRTNGRHGALCHALDALARVPASELRPVVRALDLRVRDASTPPLLKAEAATALLRFALGDASWRSVAVASVQALEDVDDDHAGPMVCRLASLAYEQFGDRECVRLLERLSEAPGTAPQAAFERGLVEIGATLGRHDLAAVSSGLREAHAWFEKACRMAEDRRDARTYLLLIELLVPVAEGRRIEDRTAAERLREEVAVHVMWDSPAPGAGWLHPRREAVLEWIPLADGLVKISDRLSEASWLDAGRVLSDVVEVYSATRSVQPFAERVVRPAIEAAFVRERGLLAHLDQWLDFAGKERLDASDARLLRRNIRDRAEEEPGKARRALRRGGRTSSDRSPPG